MANKNHVTQDAHQLGLPKVPGVGLWTMSLHDQSIRWTPEVSEIHGLPHLEEIPLGYGANLIGADYWEELKHAYQDCLETGIPYDIEVEFERDDGPIWVRLTGEAVRNEVGDVIGARGTVHDIDAMRRPLLEARKRVVQLEEIIASLGDGLVTVDKGGTLRYANPAAEQLLEISNAAAAGQELSEVLSDVHEAVEPHLETAKPDEPVELELELEDKVPLRTRIHRIVDGILIHIHAG